MIKTKEFDKIKIKNLVVMKMNEEKLTKKEIIDVFEKLQIPIEEKSSGKFEVWEMEPMKKTTQSFVNTY